MEKMYTYTDSFKSVLTAIKEDPIASKLLEKFDPYVYKDVILVNTTKSTSLVEVNDDKHKQKSKVGKVIRKILKDIHPADLEKFVNKYKSIQTQDEFEIVKGNKIYDYYNTDNYTNRDNTENDCSLYGSCMNNLPYLDIYTKNEDNVSLLILKDSYGKVTGRSLIFSNVESSDGYKGMDVMLFPYTSHQFLKDAFKRYADKNNIFFMSDFGRDIGLKMKLKHTDFKNYPYVDDFQLLINNYLCCPSYQDENTASICGISLTEPFKKLERTDGDYDIIKGKKYFKNLQDFENGKYSRTFDEPKLKYCYFTRSYFLDKDLYTLEEIPNGFKILFPNVPNINKLHINKGLYEKVTSNEQINVDSFGIKNNYFYYFYGKVERFFHNVIENKECFSRIMSEHKSNISLNIIYPNYLSGDFKRLAGQRNDRFVKFENGNLNIPFMVNESVYIICFKPKATGMAFDIYDTIVEEKDRFIGFTRDFKPNKRIVKVKKTDHRFNKLFENLLTEINKIELNEK